MRPKLWLTYAWRDLRSGLQGFWIFLICLALGTAAIAIVGSLGAAIDRGLVEQGQPLLGGDVEVALIHREVTPAEMAFLAGKGTVSKVGSLRAMARGNDMTALVEIKSIDGLYPLYGALALAPSRDIRDVVSGDGVAVDPILLERLGLKTGDRLRIGDKDFEIRAAITAEPDRISDGLALGPRVMMSEASLRATGLIQPGSLITWKYRVKMPEGTSLAQVREVVREAQEDHRDSGWRVRNRGSAAPGADQYIERLSYFMTLVGLTALIIGGAGIANAASAFISRRTEAIATLKCLGATQRLITGIYLTEILAVALLAIAIGLAFGAVAPAIAKATIGDLIPLPLTAGIEPRPLALAAVFGLLVTIAFTMWPLARTRHVPASALFLHHRTRPRRPRRARLCKLRRCPHHQHLSGRPRRQLHRPARPRRRDRPADPQAAAPEKRHLALCALQCAPPGLGRDLGHSRSRSRPHFVRDAGAHRPHHLDRAHLGHSRPRPLLLLPRCPQ